jgi:hypothetical protein
MDENFEATSQIQNAEHSQPKPRYFVYKSGWGREEKQYDSFTDVLADMGYREGRSKFDYPVYEPVEEFDDNSFDDDDDINWEEYTSEEPQEDESHTSSETETEQDPNRFMINGRKFENANDGFQALMDWNMGNETSVPFEVVSNTPVELRGSPPDNSGRWTWSKAYDRWKYNDDDEILSEIEDEKSIVDSLAYGIMEKCLQDISYVPSVEEAKIMALELAWGGMEHAPNSSYNQCHKMVGMVEQIVNPAELEQQLPGKRNLLIAFNEVSEACFEFDTSAHEMQQLMHMSQFIQRLDQPAVDELAVYMTANLDILKDALSCSTDRNMYVYEMMRLPYSDQVDQVFV